MAGNSRLRDELRQLGDVDRASLFDGNGKVDLTAVEGRPWLS